MSAENTQPDLEDLNVIVSGQGGDGSLTVVNLLASVLRQNGMSVYTERDVLSRIKGGITSATLRAFSGERYTIGNHIDLLVAFDIDAVPKNLRQLNENSIVLYDNSGGPLPEGVLPNTIRAFGAPLSRQAVKTFRRDIYKNSISFGLIGRILGLPDETMRVSFQGRFKRMGAQVLKYNLDALEVGLSLADELGFPVGQGLYKIQEIEPKPHMLITGNEAMAFGFLVAGGRFFAGYPITPSTDVMDWLIKWSPKYGGVVRQAEDELSAINMAIGSALTGTRTMVATCGPGLSLMQEGIGQLGMGEIPMVIVDAQRGGPSTGMPTKPEQSDLNLLVFGGHGDFPRIVLAPGNPEDCFYLAADACNLAQKYQCPVFIASDQALSQNTATIDPLDLDRVVIDQGSRMGTEDLAKLDTYKRYLFTEDGISPYTIPGTPDGMSLVTGNEHDEYGLVSTDPVNRVRMMDKRLEKMKTMLPELPRAGRFGDLDSKIGIVAIGMVFGVALEALDSLADRGIDAQYFQPRTLWPMLDETIDFVNSCDVVYVVDLNAGGQLAGLLVREGADVSKIRNLLHYDGTPIRSDALVNFVVNDQAQGLDAEAVA
ncbi:MAG: 2-oxoglutarate ferredoxin oxidoreductase subunit alpha [Gammaproteobacteria bacterium]|jgi:2-oxoglutarate ferredoxin oxidoreductase subunit alpha